MKLLVSSGTTDGAGRAMELSKEHGLDGVELQCGHVRREGLQAVKKKAKYLGVEVRNVHMPFFFPVIQRYVLSPGSVSAGLVSEAVRVKEALGAGRIVVHPFPAFLRRGPVKEVMRDVLLRSGDPSVFILENMEVRRRLGLRYEPYSIRDYDELYSFCRENGFGMTLDTAHSISKGVRPSDFFRKYAGIIKNVHVSNFLDWKAHRPLDSGRIDFPGFFRTLKKAGYAGDVTLEMNPAGRDALERSIRLLKSMLG